jgi:LEA14-like dessication related protein
MKKGWIIALGLLFVGILGAYMYYSRLKSNAEAEGGAYDGTLKPRVELSRFDFENITDDEITMNMYILLDNPLPIALKGSNVNYSFYINDQELVKESYEKVVTVNAEDSTILALPAKLKAKKMTALLEDLDRRKIDSADYRLRISFDTDVPILGEKKINIDQTRRMPTYHVPQFKVEDIDYGKLSLKAMDIAAKVNIINKNKFPYNITDTHYTVVIDGKEIAEGVQAEPILVKKEATTPVVFPVTVKPGKALGLLPKALFDKKDTPYAITFRCKVLDKNNNPMFQHSKFVTTIKGTLLDFKKNK